MGTFSILNSVLSATSGNSSTGIDVTSAVNTILYADRAPERTWQAQQATLASQASAINQLENEASTLSDGISALQDPGGALSAISATSSNSNVVTASALPGTSPGTHTVSVSQIATAGSWYSQTEASSSATLPLANFAITSGGTTTHFQTGDGANNTLDELAASINTASIGVRASVISDASGARLSLVASSTGSAADFSIAQQSGLTFSQSSAGVDALLKVDGVPITSSSNNISGAISGVTLNLAGAAVGTTVNLTLAPDTASITQTISTFVSAYNALIKDVNSQFAYNSTSKSSGPLSADGAISGLQSALLNSTNYSASSGSFPTLASLGITTNQDGTLSLNTTKLADAVVSNFSGVTGFFQGSASNGFGSALATTLNTYTDPAQGAFTVDLASISSTNQSLTDQTNTLELYLSSEQTRLTAAYNNADIALQQLPEKLKQINALLNPNSTSTGQ